MGYDWNAITKTDWKTICRDGRPCFAQLPLSTGGMKCTALDETYARGVECPFAKEEQRDIDYRTKRISEQSRKSDSDSQKRRVRKPRTTGSGMVFL